MAAIYTSNTKPDTLKADTYIMYMMFGSNFNSCKCDNTRMEKKLFLNYKDFSFNKQYSREERIIAKIDNLGEAFLDSLADIDAIVNITLNDEGSTLIFYTEDQTLIAKVNIDAKGAITFTV